MIRPTVSGRGIVLSLLCMFIAVQFSYATEDRSRAKPGDTVEDGEIYIKIKPEAAPLHISEYDGVAFTGIPSLDAVADAFGVYRIEKEYILPEWVMSNPMAHELDRYYRAYFPKMYGPIPVMEAYETCPEIEFAEFVSINKLLYEPNDPRFRGQWHLSHCGFPAAWDVCRGSDEVIIGIVDSGIDMDAHNNNDMTIHEDLEANLWQNLGEDVNGDGRLDLDDWNGDDDDDNGYPDDFYGWDFTGQDNWPNDEWGDDGGGHGTHVAGIVSAATDNETGIASAGFSCRLMISGNYSYQDPDNIAYGYRGITYCASNGADVINLSWGRDEHSNRNDRDVIQFALGQGVAVFAGVGNDSVGDYFQRETHFYPAAYGGVIGVGANNEQDRKADFSNWGDYTDLVAPGVSILSCWPHNDYHSTQGTSMSSPLAAGLGALMLAYQPDLTAEELLDVMQATATDIQDRNPNYPRIQHRINADYLLNSTHPKLELLEWSFRDQEGDQDGRPDPYEHVTMNLRISNHDGFAGAHNVRYTLEVDDPFVLIERGEGVIVENMPGGQVRDIYQNLPQVYIHWNAPPHTTTFNLTLNSDEGFPTTYELPVTIAQPLYLIVDDDNGENFQTYYQLDLENLSLVHDIWSISDDGLPSQAQLNEYSFVIWETGSAQQPLSVDEQELMTEYLDGGGRLILSSQYAGDNHGDSPLFSDYLHVNHTIDNVNDPQLSGVEGNPVTDAEMWFLMIGGTGANNNISPSAMEPLNGAQPIFTYQRGGEVAGVLYTNEIYQVIYLGFALEAASGLGDSTPRIVFLERALEHFYQVEVIDNSTVIPSVFDISQPWPNPFNSSTTVHVSIPSASNITLDVTDISGRNVVTLAQGWKNAGTHSYTWDGSGAAAGIYLFTLNCQNGSISRKVTLLK